MNRVIDDLKRNIDKKTVVSGVVTAFVVGGILFALNKSNIKALKTVASVAKGGK
mgnify:CR=1 FL=1